MIGFTMIIIVIIVSGIIMITSTESALIDESGEFLKDQTTELIAILDSQFAHEVLMFELISEDHQIKTELKLSNKYYDKLDDPQKIIDEVDKRWILYDGNIPESQELINNDLSIILREKIRFFEDRHGENTIGEIFVTNKHGANVGQTGLTTDFKQNDENWWTIAKQNGVFIDKIQHDQSANIYSTDIAIRIDDEDGKFLGVMKIVPNTEKIFNIIEEFHEKLNYFHSRIILLNSEQDVLYSTDNLPANLLFDTGFVFDKNTDYLITSINGLETLAAYSNSENYDLLDKLGWIIVLQVPTNEILKDNGNFTTFLFILLLLSIIPAIIFGIYVNRNVSKPLSALKMEIMDFGKNNNIANYNKNEIHENEIHENEIHENEIHENEIHELETEFNKMKSLVEKNEANMNKIISQKTTELNKAITELKAHSDLQTDFINIASHELRTPIQPILNQAELASQGIKPTNDALRIILKNAKHLSRLTEDILEVSRIERGSINYNFEKINLSELLYEIISNQKENAKTIPINLDVKSDAIINADKVKLNQAISM